MEVAENWRYEQLFKQIIEIAQGNFEYRNKLTGKRDKLDTLAELLNMMSEEIAYFDYEKRTQPKTRSAKQHLFIDQSFNIQAYTPQFYRILGDKQLEKHKSLYGLLDEASQEILKNELTILKNQKNTQTPFFLDFQVSDKRLIRLRCNLKILKTNKSKKNYLLSLSEVFKNPNLNTSEMYFTTDYKSLKTKSTSNRLLTRRVKLYILRNLDKTLPSLKEIGLIHRTNQTKLKEEFKKAFGTTIYRFHNTKRLEHAALLLSTTELAIGDISIKCGFKDQAHFTKKFKEAYTLTPRQFRSKHA